MSGVARVLRPARQLTVLALLLAGCSESQTGPVPQPPPAAVAAIELSHSTLTLELGDSLRLEAIARDAAAQPLTGRT